MSIYFDTKTLALPAGMAVNLAADPDVVAGRTLTETSAWCFIQNTGQATVYWRETSARPSASERGHVLSVGAGVVILLVGPFWLWAPEGGHVTVSDGAPTPTRGA